ncbi:hypothetical protein DFH09DRAFT_1322097 [Mycena vulgaris]|nr:hypothetical protein DFH09DRAFT_1322097 [Mycena vulgaris]
MKNNGHTRNIVIVSERTYANVQPSQVEEVEAHRDEYLAFTICLGGQRFFACYKNVLADIMKAVASIASPAEMELFRATPVDVQAGDWSKKYMDPITIFAHFTDPGIRTKIRNQRLFAASKDLAWYADTIDPAHRSWAMGIWSLNAVSNDIKKVLKYIRAAMVLHMCKTPAVVSHIAQMTQGDDGLNAHQRTLAVAETIDAHYFPHPTDPLIYIYMKPINDNVANNEALKGLLRVTALAYKMFSFTPKSRNGDPSECVLCKADTHLAYLCPLPHSVIAGDEWWGPPDQMSKLTEGILATARLGAAAAGNNNGGGNGGGGGGGNRNGARRYGNGNSGGNNTGGSGNNNAGRRRRN